MLAGIAATVAILTPVLLVFIAQRLVSKVSVRLVRNDDDIAKQAFLTLLAEAENEMVIYDDGNDDPGSLYNDAEVIALVVARLERTPELYLSCVFNDDDDTAFKTTLRDNNQVEARPRKSNPTREHYKIIDGRKGYISRHEHGSSDRDAKWIDATALWPWLSRWFVFRRYLDDHKRYA